MQAAMEKSFNPVYMRKGVSPGLAGWIGDVCK
jgi:hypothetical protein